MPGSCTTICHDVVGNGELKLDVKLNEPILVYPAEPTEKQVHFLSNLDQNLAVTVSTVYFFNSRKDKKNHDPVSVIKDSLRKLLVLYYPMAGRLSLSEDFKFQVQCEDQGVLFVEATADCFIADLGELYRPAPFMTQLVYNNPPMTAMNILDSPLMCVQVTKFKCGGFVLGLSISHCMADAYVASELVLAWGELARGPVDNISHLVPHLDRTILKSRTPPRIEFPHVEFDDVDEVCSPRTMTNHDQSSKPICSSFIFSPQQVETVRRRILDDGLVTKVTTFEALTALSWRARTQAVEMHPKQVARLVFAMNIRKKLDPPLPTRFMGNGVFFGNATATAAELTHNPLSHTVKLVQEAKALVTDQYIRSAIDYFEVTRARPKWVATLHIASWVGIPLEKVDFGWGQPVCMVPTNMMDDDAFIAPCGKDMKSFQFFIGLPSSRAVEIFRQCLSSCTTMTYTSSSSSSTKNSDQSCLLQEQKHMVLVENC
ncbi:unnamed protein product [Sphagnum compactum]